MEPVNVLSTVSFSDEQLVRLRVLSPKLDVVQYPARDADEVPSDVWSRVEVLCTFGALPASDQAPHLRWVQLMSAGADHAVDHPMFQGGVALTTTSGIHAINIAELVLAMMLAWGQRLPTLSQYQRRAEWPENRLELFVPQELRGATIGIVGYGSIGREVGRLAHAFGMRILAFDVTDDRVDHGYAMAGIGDPKGVLPQRYYHPGELRAMLAECDYVVLAVPLTNASRNMVGADELEAIKPSAFLINIGRGGVVDESALVRALQEGWIAGAGLDVFAQEPLPASSPLWKMDNIILSPHIAGLTPHYNERAADVFGRNLRRYLDGRPLLNQVDLEKGF